MPFEETWAQHLVFSKKQHRYSQPSNYNKLEAIK